jgi:hypothetical protein
MKSTSEMIAVMKAFEEGKKIECFNKRVTGSWVLSERPIWDWGFCDYRIAEDKPVPKFPEGFEFCEIDWNTGTYTKTNRTIESIVCASLFKDFAGYGYEIDGKARIYSYPVIFRLDGMTYEGFNYGATVHRPKWVVFGKEG